MTTRLDIAALISLYGREQLFDELRNQIWTILTLSDQDVPHSQSFLIPKEVNPIEWLIVNDIGLGAYLCVSVLSDEELEQLLNQDLSQKSKWSIMRMIEKQALASPSKQLPDEILEALWEVLTEMEVEELYEILRSDQTEQIYILRDGDDYLSRKSNHLVGELGDVEREENSRYGGSQTEIQRLINLVGPQRVFNELKTTLWAIVDVSNNEYDGEELSSYRQFIIPHDDVNGRTNPIKWLIFNDYIFAEELFDRLGGYKKINVEQAENIIGRKLTDDEKEFNRIGSIVEFEIYDQVSAIRRKTGEKRFPSHFLEFIWDLVAPMSPDELWNTLYHTSSHMISVMEDGEDYLRSLDSSTIVDI